MTTTTHRPVERRTSVALTGAELRLIADALEALNPDTDEAQALARSLGIAFDVFAHGAGQ